MPLYKLTKGSIGLIVDGENVDIEKGDTVELPEERAKDFKYLKRMGEGAGKAQQIVSTHSEEGEANFSRDWSTTQDMKASDVVDLINETDSKEELTALKKIEERGQNRIGVMKAIDKRMGQI